MEKSLSLLLKEVSCGQLGGFSLQAETHPLVTAILLGTATLDPFNANAHLSHRTASLQ
jgi:hypothetical protein